MAQTLIEWTWRRLPLTALSGQQMAAALKLGGVLDGADIILPGFTFNPWIGCRQVSPGCANCYAAALDERRFSKTLGGATKDAPVIHFGKGAPRHRTSVANWRAPLIWNRQAQELGVTLRVFCASLADWLDDEVPLEWFADLIALIRATPWIDWILVTKRPENFAKRMTEWRITQLDAMSCPRLPRETYDFATLWAQGHAPSNVWVLTSVEDQPRADQRIPWLLNIPAAVHGVSLEPLLGPVDLLGWLTAGGCASPGTAAQKFHGKLQLDWGIVGGESGDDTKAPDGRVLRGIRPMHPEWARSLRDQFKAAGAAFFFKQWGEFKPCEDKGRTRALAHYCDATRDFKAQGEGVAFKRVGKAAAGNLLDGRKHVATPEPRLRADNFTSASISSLTK